MATNVREVFVEALAVAGVYGVAPNISEDELLQRATPLSNLSQ
ncbi:MAG TPA: hypothetical protein VMU05_24965 [Dongiaceae bacterium]|nr:hypothetical protein [Dongiaceae bacterium]